MQLDTFSYYGQSMVVSKFKVHTGLKLFMWYENFRV
jgi:hypothetical protein